MNHTAYRHVSMPCLVMRGCLWLMLEGSGKFEVVEHARDGAETVAVWAVRNRLLDEWRRRLFRRLPAGAHCGEAAPPKAGDDADNSTYIFIEPRVGYRMPKGAKQRE